MKRSETEMSDLEIPDSSLLTSAARSSYNSGQPTPKPSCRNVVAVAVAMLVVIIVTAVVTALIVAPSGPTAVVTSGTLAKATAADATVKSDFDKMFDKEVAAVLSGSSAGFFELIQCQSSKCVGDAFTKIATGVAKAVLSTIPVIGPFLAGLVGLFTGHSVSIWDQIKNQVDREILLALNTIREEWIMDDLDAAASSAQEYSGYPDCHREKRANIPSINFALKAAGVTIGNLESGKTPTGTFTDGSTQRALMGFLPQTALLNVVFRAEQLELIWDAGASDDVNVVACKNSLTTMQKEINFYRSVAKSGISVTMAYAEGGGCTDKCTEGQWRPYHNNGVSGNNHDFACGEVGNEHTLSLYYARFPARICLEWKTVTGIRGTTSRECVTYDSKNKLDYFKESCLEWKKPWLDAISAKWQRRLTDPLNTWLSATTTLDKLGYCDATSGRHVAGTGNERFGIKSFIDAKLSKCKGKTGSAFSSCWRGLDGVVAC